MQEFKKRLVEFARTQYNMGQTRFEEKCDIHPGTISAIKSNGPTASVITKIAFACPELNLNWLFRGTGDMIIHEQSTYTPQNDIHHNQQVVIANWSDLKDVLTEVIKAQGK